MHTLVHQCASRVEKGLNIRAQHEYKYFHGYLWVHPWENLYKQITCVQVPGA